MGTLEKLNAGIHTSTLFDNIGKDKPETTLMEDIVDISRGASNQLGLMPVAQGVMHTVFDPLTTALGGKGTADSNLDLSDKNILDRAIERFKYGYNTTKANEEESMARNPLKYTLANIAGGLATPAGAIGNLATKPVGLALSKAPVLGKVGKALTEKGLTKTVVDNAVEGAIGGANFSEEGGEGSGAALGTAIGAGIPLLGTAIKKGTPLLASVFGGANLKNANLYAKNYPEIAKSLENATQKFDNIENAIETNVSKLNNKYDSAIHDIGSSIANNTEKIVQEQDNLVNGVRNQLINAYNNVEDKIMQSSYKARGSLRKDAFVDVSGIKKELDDIIENSKINGKSYSASNDTSMKSIEQIRDDLVEIAKEGKISEKDLWRYMHDVLSPLSKYSNKELKGYVPPSVAVARVMRHEVDDLLKTANPAYKKAMKPTAEMTSFIRKDFPKVIDLDSMSSKNVIKNIGSNAEGLDVLKKLVRYNGTKLDNDLNRIIDINKKLPTSFVGKDNLQMTGVLNKQGEGLSIEQIQKTLGEYDKINGTNFSEQWNKARKEGKRDTIEALTELREASKMTDTDKRGMSYLGKSWTGYDPEVVDGKQSWWNRTIEGNEANPLNVKLAKDKKAIKATTLISDLTGMDKNKLEKFARNLSLDKALDTSATNGSRNVKLLGGTGALIGGGIEKLVSDDNYDQSKNPITQAVPTTGATIGGILGLLAGGVRDYGLANRLFKELVKVENKVGGTKEMKGLEEFLNRASTRTEGVREYLNETKKQADRAILDSQDKFNQHRMAQMQMDPMIQLKNQVENKREENLKNFGRSGS